MIEILCNSCGCSVEVPHRINDKEDKKELHICNTCWTNIHIEYLNEYDKIYNISK